MYIGAATALIPMAMPRMSRATSSAPTPGATADATDPMMNTTPDAMRLMRRPKRSMTAMAMSEPTTAPSSTADTTVLLPMSLRWNAPPM